MVQNAKDKSYQIKRIRRLKILIGCEFSGIVREAFRKKGHEAWSCDIIPSDDNSKYHIQDDILNHLDDNYDMLICFPPCTHLCSSGARWFKDKIPQQKEALEFVKKLLNCNISKIALENPIGIISTRIKKPTQIIQPYEHGHGETKATCLWLKNLPKLKPTNIVNGREARIHNMPPTKDRSKLRSITYFGIAKAMSNQWT